MERNLRHQQPSQKDGDHNAKYTLPDVCRWCRLQEAWEGFRQMGNVLKSVELQRLTTGPAAFGMAAPLKKLQQFTDWEQAAELGRIVPHSGADAAFDDADARV